MGKTTTAETFANLGTLIKENCLFMSTINFSINGKIKEESDLTNPDPITINKNISEAFISTCRIYCYGGFFVMALHRAD